MHIQIPMSSIEERTWRDIVILDAQVANTIGEGDEDMHKLELTGINLAFSLNNEKFLINSRHL